MSERLAARDDLMHWLTRYEGAVQAANDDGDDESIKELEKARNRLVELLQQAKVYVTVDDETNMQSEAGKQPSAEANK
ncbi:MAG: hypothetical protein PVS2B2_26810 [Candidatus Acidiferrum sp.]